MAVTIIRPGTSVHDDNFDLNEWTFNAVVNGRAGTITVTVPDSDSEAEAARVAQLSLEAHPENLGGIV